MKLWDLRRPGGEDVRRYLIIGNGVAGARAAVKIREADPEGEIHIFTEEAYPFYYRVRFPEMVAGESGIRELTIHTKEYYESKAISFHPEEGISAVDPGRREATSGKGKTYPYDRLLMATGARAFVPPIKGVEKKGVFTLRTMRDAIEMKEFSENVGRAILIGGGLVGLETGGALLRRGAKVAVIEHNPRILPRQTDTEAAGVLQEKMERMGFSFFLNEDCEEILGGEKAEGVRLKDGRLVEGEMVIISAGVRPDLRLAGPLGLEVKNGISVNDRMETTGECIFAAGDVAEHRGRCYGIWPAAQKQGETAGMNMAGGDVLYNGTVVSNALKVVGVALTAMGEIDGDGTLECVVREDREKGVYRKVAFKEDKIIGCILLGDAKGGMEILNAIERRIDVRDLKGSILEETFDFRKLR
jgi:nitrite reductase (NADH) large subunit